MKFTITNNTLFKNKITKQKFIKKDSLISEILIENREKSAEWNYLYSLYLYNKAFVESAVTHIEKAISLDPANEEYKEALEGITSTDNIKYFKTNTSSRIQLKKDYLLGSSNDFNYCDLHNSYSCECTLFDIELCE